jgi:5-methyltetrahydropteroyltriglutamate--homocysteine methyltransferase
MTIKSSIHSSFPRIGEHPDEQKLRRAFAAFEEGKISHREFEEIQNQLIRDILSIEDTAGINIVTDGLIRWYDPASHIAKCLKGIEINGLLRFFDTNFYYRQPIISEDISSGDGALSSEIGYIKSNSTRQIKAVMLGPISLAGMSLNKSSMDFQTLCLKLSEIMSDEVSKLSEAGANYIQIDEPWLVRNPEHIGLLKECFGKLSLKKNKSKLILGFYFGDCSKILGQLHEIPADIYGFDFTYSPKLLDKIIADGFHKSVSFGILDGRNTRLEDAREVTIKLKKALNKVDSSDCQITTSCGLEFLPRQYAIKKLELTVQIAKMING